MKKHNCKNLKIKIFQEVCNIYMNNGNDILRLLEKLIIKNSQNQKENSIILIPLIEEDFNAHIKKIS